MTLVVIGGGPTGVELAGAFAELARTVLKRDFRRIDPTHARIILTEASPVVLSHLPPDLAASATDQLKRLGVQAADARQNIRSGEVALKAARRFVWKIFWAAGSRDAAH
jgi:NADH dehydrogenase